LPSFPNEKIVKVASVGCSTGEEVYSFLMKNWKEKDRLQIDGYDSNPDNIKTAIDGQYGFDMCEISDKISLEELEESGLCPEAFKYCPPERDASRYSQSRWRNIKFTENATKRVRFRTHDIFDKKLPENYDVVLINNVLYHYPEKGREKILGKIKDSLDEGGWLLCEQEPSKDQDYIRWMRNIRHLGFVKQSGYPKSQFYRKKIQEERK